jgi:hypothetical protein
MGVSSARLVAYGPLIPTPGFFSDAANSSLISFVIYACQRLASQPIMLC